MKTLIFKKDGADRLGVKTDRGVIDVEALVREFVPEAEQGAYPTTWRDLVQGGEALRERLTELLAKGGGEAPVLSEESLTFGPCVPHPQKIICVGLNYRKHAEEAQMPIPERPILFSKFNNALTGHRAPVTLPDSSQQVDFEGELGLVIGRTAKDVSVGEALSYVYGYCNANDVSARDLQMQSTQWLLGKTCDGFCPVGPYLVSADEVKDPNALAIRTTVNGEERQNSNTQDMIFSCEEIISYCSKHMTLFPGDLILTGTPEGVILGDKEEERVWLQENDVVAIEIEGLGTLSNTMVR